MRNLYSSCGYCLEATDEWNQFGACEPIIIDESENIRSYSHTPKSKDISKKILDTFAQMFCFKDWESI